MPPDIYIPGPKIGLEDKLLLDLMPVEAVISTTRALQYGANKYAAHGWERSAAADEFPWSVAYGATLRHLFKWWGDIDADIDDESGLHHLDHVGANVAFLQTFVARRIGRDNRCDDGRNIDF